MRGLLFDACQARTVTQRLVRAQSRALTRSWYRRRGHVLSISFVSSVLMTQYAAYIIFFCRRGACNNGVSITSRRFDISRYAKNR